MIGAAQETLRGWAVPAPQTALDELRAELAHADTLIADQQARIDALEAEVAELRTKR